MAESSGPRTTIRERICGRIPERGLHNVVIIGLLVAFRFTLRRSHIIGACASLSRRGSLGTPLAGLHCWWTKEPAFGSRSLG